LLDLDGIANRPDDGLIPFHGIADANAEGLLDFDGTEDSMGDGSLDSNSNGINKGKLNGLLDSNKQIT
jgi:hypothetical protein